MTRQKNLFWAVFLLIFCVPSQKLIADDDGLVAKARKEKGIITWYTALNITTSKPLAEMFEKKYPFLKVDLYRAGNERVLNRILTEEDAGQRRFDVASLSYLPNIAKKGFLSRHRSKIVNEFIDGFYDPEGYWVTLSSNLIVLGYNTGLIKKENAPTEWEDLLNPQWSGKLGIDPQEGAWFGAMLKYKGQEEGVKFFKALARQKLHWHRGHSLLAQLVAAGEFPLAIVYGFNIIQLRERGAPIEWVLSTKPVVATRSGIGISAKTDAPASSKLFMDFALSKEAQNLIIDSGRFSGRKDLQTIKDLDTFVIPGEIIVNLDHYMAKFREIMKPE
jgi:iron(III) transport system substrate-binding protein